MASKQNTVGWDIPKRYLRLSIYSLQTEKPVRLYYLNERMRIKFNTVAACSGALTEANIVIGGLHVESMFNISTASTQWMSNWYQHEVVIEAGYYGNYSVIFRGTILEASANLNSADYTLTIKAISGFAAATTPASDNYPGKVSVTSIAADLARKNNLGFVDGLKDNSIKVVDFSYQNQSLPTIIRQISSAVPVDLYVDSQRLYLKGTGDSLARTSPVTIMPGDIVGTPQPTATGCKVKVLMRHGLITGQNMKLNSLKYSKYNSTNFYLQTLAYSGDTYGSDWFTELELVKIGLGFRK